MGKRKKKNLSEKVQQKRKTAVEKINPFEIRVNKRKHDVLNEKVQKHDKGMPGASRSKADKKRKETLLLEYTNRNKVNQVVDRRIITSDDQDEETREDNRIKKFTIERQKHHRSSLYNLNDDIELTHYGQSLSEIEKFNDPVVGDDDDDYGTIDASIVGDMHFGGGDDEIGGIFKKRDGDEKQKSWREKMADVISKSKQKKAEEQNARNEIQDQTEKLDADWKELRMLMKFGESQKEEEKKKVADDYTITMNKLRLEARAQASDRMKTEEELAEEEQKTLRKLEEDRLRRMRGQTDAPKAVPHRSADELDDAYLLDKPVRAPPKRQESDEEDEASDDNDEENDDDEESDEDNSDVDNEEDDDNEEGEDDEDSDEDGEDDSGEDGMQQMSDLESDDDDEEEEENEEEKEKQQPAKQKAVDTMKLLQEKKHIMETARKEIPYTFDAPKDLDALVKLLSSYNDKDQITVIQRIRKCNHPSLAEGNKEKMQTFFRLLLEYTHVLCDQAPPRLALVDKLTIELFDMCRHNAVSSAHAVVDIISQAHTQYLEYQQARGRGIYPPFGVLITMKQISTLFPTSDFHHHVITPTMVYMSQLLSQSNISTRRDICSGMFVCNLFLEYISFSKRFVPEAINFLCGVLFLATKKEPNEMPSVLPPFKPFGAGANMLLVDNADAVKCEVKPLKMSDVFCKKRFRYLSTDEFKVCVLYQCLQIIEQYSDLYKSLPSYKEIFAPVLHFLAKIPTEMYPQQIKDSIAGLVQEISNTTVNLKPLVIAAEKPQPLKQFEPKFRETFDGKKHRAGNKDTAQRQRLLHKVKREKKGAIREIRKDMQYIAKVKQQQTLKRDKTRKKYTKRIYAEGAMQEAELRNMKRRKF